MNEKPRDGAIYFHNAGWYDVVIESTRDGHALNQDKFNLGAGHNFEEVNTSVKIFALILEGRRLLWSGHVQKGVNTADGPRPGTKFHLITHGTVFNPWIEVIRE